MTLIATTIVVLIGLLMGLGLAVTWAVVASLAARGYRIQRDAREGMRRWPPIESNN